MRFFATLRLCVSCFDFPTASKSLGLRPAGRERYGSRKAMMREFKESDWKILRQVRSEALERFCKQILSEIERMNSDSAKSFHRKYSDIWELLRRRDKELAQAFDNPRRSAAFIQLASMKGLGLLTEDEFLRFSQETRDAVDLLLGSSHT